MERIEGTGDVLGLDWAADEARRCHRRRVTVRGLLVPWDERRPCLVTELTLTAVALSDAIGGGLLDEGLQGEIDGTGYTVYLDEDRAQRGLPGNQRAAVLLARLRHVDRALLAGLRGDALILGRDCHEDDTDVPVAVIDAARRGGLLSTPARPTQ